MTEPILVEKRIEATPATVYDFLVDPALVPTWFGKSCMLQAELHLGLEWAPRGATGLDARRDRAHSGWRRHARQADSQRAGAQ